MGRLSGALFIAFALTVFGGALYMGDRELATALVAPLGIVLGLGVVFVAVGDLA